MIKSRRGKLLIYPRFQLGLILGNLAILMGVVSLVIFVTLSSFRRLESEGAKAGLLPTHPYFDLIRYQKQYILIGVGFALLLGVLLSVIYFLSLSNKIAGPIVRLQEFFRELLEKKGRLEKEVSFRKGDFFQDLPDLVNNALKEVNRNEKR